MGPLLVLLPLVGLATNVGQAGPVLSGRALVPDFDRISPLAGLRRFFSPLSDAKAPIPTPVPRRGAWLE